MMEHARYRMLIVADPRSAAPELREHRESCQECSLYTERLLRFESRLERALKLDMPTRADELPFAARAASRAAPRRWSRMAIAAGVLLCMAVAGGVWLALPGTSLAADVVAHMAGEPQAWQRTDVAVPDPRLNAVLRDSKLQLAPSAGTVTYASSCFFRGHYVPHLVVQTDFGPVTVMVLVHESVNKPVQFDEQGYRGTIAPMPGHGSIAVLLRDPGVNREEVAQVAAKVRESIVWTP
jgi:Protein of unknown function (DUF3379)